MARSMRVTFIPDGGTPVTGTLVEIPPDFWGPNDPRPSHPISGIPGLPGYEPPQQPGEPPVIWPNPPEGTAPIPGHPIVLPGDPSWGPPPDIGPQPPDPAPPGCVWGYTDLGWVLVCGPYEGGKPRPPGVGVKKK